MVAAVLLARPAPVSACDCVQRAWSIPADGDEAVPVDVEPLLVVGLRASDVRVTLAGGGVAKAATLVELASFRGDRMVRVVPDLPLEPDTTYRLRLGDPDDPAADLSFRTGDGGSAGSPAVPVVAGISARRADVLEPTSCGDQVVAVGLEVVPAADAVAYQLHLAGGGADETLVVLPDELDQLGGLVAGCGLPVSVLYWPPSVCVEVRALDLAGHASEAALACGEFAACEPVACADCVDFVCEPPPEPPRSLKSGCAAGGPGSLVGALALLGLLRRRRRCATLSPR